MSGVPAVSDSVPSSLSEQRHRRLAADVEPEAGGDAATLVLAQWRAPVRMRLGGLQRLDHADRPELRPVGGFRALLGRVLEAQLDRVHADLAGDLVDHALDRELGDRPARRAIGRDLRPVRHHVVADDLDVLQVVGRVGAHAARLHRRAGKGAGLVLELGFRGDDAPVLLGADLDAHVRARGRARGAEHLLARHHHLHGAPGLLGQRQCDRLEVDHGLAAEAAADLRRGDADPADVPSEQPRAVRAHDPMALRRHPHVGLAVLRHARHAGVRLDVALVHRLGRERALDDEIGLLEAGGDVAQHELDALGHVRGRLGRGVHAGREHIVMQQRRARLHGLDHVDDVRQHLVVDLDELQRPLGDLGAGGGHCRDRVALIERLLARHHVAHDILVVDHHLARRDELGGLVLEVHAGDDGLDAGELLRRRGVDRLDARVRMRASQHLADDLAGHDQVGAEPGAARHLVDPVRPIGARADPFELRTRRALHLLLHGQAPLISAAASITARTILS